MKALSSSTFPASTNGATTAVGYQAIQTTGGEHQARVCAAATKLGAFLLLVLWILSVAGCQCNSYVLDPCIHYTPQQRHIRCLPSAFPSLSNYEKTTEWGKELHLGQRFAREMDLYRAITCFKSALFLLPPEAADRQPELEYDIILAYFLGGKYQDVIETFECSSLVTAGPAFTAFPELLIMLYESYLRDCRYDRAEGILELIQRHSPETARDLSLQHSIVEGEVACARAQAYEHPDCAEICPCLDSYCCCAKSVKKAQTLNAVLPGAGYYYVGQKSTAVTSFLLNTLFTAAAWYFFDDGNIAAGIITTSLEAGWYFGGINGAGLAAKEYNERIWEECGRETMIRNRLFPVLMLEHSF